MLGWWVDLMNSKVSSNLDSMRVTAWGKTETEEIYYVLSKSTPEIGKKVKVHFPSFPPSMCKLEQRTSRCQCWCTTTIIARKVGVYGIKATKIKPKVSASCIFSFHKLPHLYWNSQSSLDVCFCILLCPQMQHLILVLKRAPVLSLFLRNQQATEATSWSFKSCK